MRKRYRQLFFPVIVTLFGIGLVAFLTNPFQEETVPVETVRLAAYRGEFSSLIWIAETQGFFTDNGLEVIIETYDNGVVPVSELIAGRVDIATAGEFVTVMRGFENPGLRTIGTIDLAEAVEVLGKRDHGIRQPADLKGKRIGLKKGSQAEFFLGMFLLLNQLSYDDVVLVDLSPGRMADALSQASVDAVVVWDPFAFRLKQTFGENIVSWSAQSDRKFYFLLNMMDAFLKAKPEVVNRFLRAMVQAEAFVQANGEEAKAQVQNYLGLEEGYLQSVWAKNDFRVTLSQDLLMTMEDEADWALEHGLTDATWPPVSLDLLYVDGLEQVKPGGVDVIY
jgi:ABC-type nitrate/sulfonate/bicarbonate transport system substrate-binding protein